MLTIDFNKLDLADDDRVLDLGCGEGRHIITAYLLKNIRGVALDLDIENLKIARTRFDAEFSQPQNDLKSLVFSVGNGLSLPFGDASFDKVICSEVMEHIADEISLIREIKRVLKPSGTLAVSVPRFFPEWLCWQLSREYHSNAGGHIRIFRAGQLNRAITGQGFRFVGRHWAHALHVPYWWLQCLFWKKRESSALIKAYHRFLVWDLIKKPLLTRFLDSVLNPLMGKSVVMYFLKDA